MKEENKENKSILNLVKDSFKKVQTKVCDIVNCVENETHWNTYDSETDRITAHIKYVYRDGTVKERSKTIKLNT